MELDDRSLADIGIHRLQICALAEGARKRTEFPMNNFTPNHETVLATRQHTSAEFVLKNPDAALATMRRPASLLSPAKRSYLDTQPPSCPAAIRHTPEPSAVGRGRERN